SATRSAPPGPASSPPCSAPSNSAAAARASPASASAAAKPPLWPWSWCRSLGVVRLWIQERDGKRHPFSDPLRGPLPPTRGGGDKGPLQRLDGSCGAANACERRRCGRLPLRHLLGHLGDVVQ